MRTAPQLARLAALWVVSKGLFPSDACQQRPAGRGRIHSPEVCGLSSALGVCFDARCGTESHRPVLPFLLLCAAGTLPATFVSAGCLTGLALPACLPACLSVCVAGWNGTGTGAAAQLGSGGGMLALLPSCVCHHQRQRQRRRACTAVPLKRPLLLALPAVACSRACPAPLLRLPALPAEAQDRAFRIGQRRDVSVYRFITAGGLRHSQERGGWVRVSLGASQPSERVDALCHQATCTAYSVPTYVPPLYCRHNGGDGVQPPDLQAAALGDGA